MECKLGYACLEEDTPRNVVYTIRNDSVSCQFFAANEGSCTDYRDCIVQDILKVTNKLCTIVEGVFANRADSAW